MRHGSRDGTRVAELGWDREGERYVALIDRLARDEQLP